MFERFTERARQVVVLAQEEARILKHGHIGPEHLLLGSVRTDEGLAARVLESLEVTVDRVRAEVVRRVGTGAELTSGQVPFSPEGKKALERSSHQARALGHDYIGTGHILLAVMCDEEGIAVGILRELGVDPKTVQAEVIGAIERSSVEPLSHHQLPTARVPERMLDGTVTALRWVAGEVEQGLGRLPDSGDLLVVLASVPEGLAARTLARLGVDPGSLAAAAKEIRGDATRQQLASDPALLAEAEQVCAEKETAIAAQDFEQAANLRDRERRLRNRAREIADQQLDEELMAAARTHLRLPAD